ncbi:hmg-CoA reductase [Viridothelium virens]|uniref:3-hydroxy-3-methylglutaryl coenzyme A reductase n=1 Tax=Viridothelium virens TaxID=1048519 RepID=A0A6A6HG66_VIRVR|nr:hmg-CoA reductase [Viridothelium virens]
MLFSSWLPASLRGSPDASQNDTPGWFNRTVTPVLLSVSRRACSHPIHTIGFIAVLSSTAYMGLLESSLFEPPVPATSETGKANFNGLLAGSKRMRLGDDTAWKWQMEDNGKGDHRQESLNDLALLTFVFPESSSGASYSAPSAQTVPVPKNCSARVLPCSTNPLSAISQDTTLAFSVPYHQAPHFLDAVREIPLPVTEIEEEKEEGEEESPATEPMKWIMKAARPSNGSNRGIRTWAMDVWTSFLDLVKNAETLDITIMVLGYLSMHLTFVSLFLSMRRLGSNFWLATTVLFHSFFALFFALMVTISLGVPINMVLLSEGLPFLVVTIGFEKPIILTKAVLTVALARKRAVEQANGSPSSSNGDMTPMTISGAVQTAVKERGFEIVRDYFVEIVILIAGAASGVQGGLRQFCFLAAWILFFDCVLLFTFYTAILTVKLEINRIKRHVSLRKALEEDGVSRRVAESVASSEDWPGSLPADTDNTTSGGTIFGRKIRESSVPKFKIIMVSGFIIINLLNTITLPFRGRHHAPSTTSGLSNVVTLSSMDPFKVAGTGLDAIFIAANKTHSPTTVTVFTPIKYELQDPSVHHSLTEDLSSQLFEGASDQIFDRVGGRVVDGILKSLEDPILSKWIIAALAMSLVLNGYLFNAARWSIKDSTQPEPAEAAANAEAATDQATGQSELPPPPNDFVVLEPEEPEEEEKDEDEDVEPKKQVQRTQAECETMLKAKKAPLLNDAELISLSLRGKIPGYALEKTLEDKTRAVKIRRGVISRTPGTLSTSSLLEKSKLPYKHFDYERVFGACCENVIGYMPLPVGVAGPLTIDGRNYFLPMATTEGVLVASTSRGCKAINAGGGATTVITADGMTRGPCIGFATLVRAGAAKLWLDSDEGQKVMRSAFNSTSRFARLQSMKTALAGTYLYIRFKTITGDAMGMNMISKGVEHALDVMANDAGFPDMQIISLSGNYCTDKKPAAINWIDGRGKSVVAEAIIPGDVVRTVLKSSVDALVELNTSKNLIGSAMAGSIGGFNAHAANIVAAIFLATGQDPAQVVESSNCIVTMKNLGGSLQIAVSLPCLEVGTIGGGTILEPQSAMLDLLGVRGAHQSSPGANAQQLARVIGAGVLAGELSLCSALAAGHLVKAHMSHNRSQVNSAAPTRVGTPKVEAQGFDVGVPSSQSGSDGRGAPFGNGGVPTPVGLAMSSVRERARDVAGEGGR